MDFVPTDQVVDHGGVSAKAPSCCQDSEDVQKLQLVLLSHDVLEEVSDAETGENGVHHAGEAHSKPHEDELSFRVGHIEIHQHVHFSV